jgi:serine/threonine protein kinase
MRVPGTPHGATVASTTSPADLLGRTLLGRYRIVMPIGHGGMGTVYLARTEGAAGFAKPVVIKQILPSLVADGAMVQLFIREARLLANLHHPGIVNVLDFGEEEGAYVMVLEYVHGYTLAEWAKYVLTARGRVPVEFLLHIMARVLDALHYAHTYRRPDGKAMVIIHRDVSPGNVLLDLEGHIKLADFGIARAKEDPGEYRSRVGSFKGKLAYSAPELVAGEEATPRSDVYATGVVLLHLLLGRNPFKGQTMADSVHRVLNLEPARASAERDDCPAGLDEVLAQALAKSPKQRFADAAAFAAALRKLHGQPDDAVGSALAKQLREDFESDMADLLELEPLQRRDAAWRGSHDAEAMLRSTVPPPQPSRVAEQATVTDISGDGSLARTSRTQATQRLRSWLVPLVATTAAIVGAVVAVLMLNRAQPQSPPKFLVIDRKGVEDEAKASPLATPAADLSEPAPTSESSSSAAASAAPPARMASGTAATPGRSAGPDTAELSRAVQRHGGRIQSCFQSHVESVGGAPQVTLRFSIDAAGNVTSAQLSPGTLAGTPLGGCLLGVARSIKFPPQGKPVSFSIPITARVSK